MSDEQIPTIELPPGTAREVRAIAGFEDADRALLALRIAETELSTIGAGFDAQIQALQEAKQSALQPIQRRVERMNERLEAFTVEHKGELGGRSWSGVHGTIGFRKGSVRVELDRDEADVLDMLRRRGHDQCVVTTTKLDKRQLKKLTGVELTVCGVSTHQDEKFFIKLAKSPAIVYPQVDQADEQE